MKSVMQTSEIFKVLLVIEATSRRACLDSLLRGITSVRQLCGLCAARFSVLVVGHDADQTVARARTHGAESVLVAETRDLDLRLPENVVPTVQRVVRDNAFDIVVGLATTTGRDWMARLAGCLDSPYVGDCVGIVRKDAELVFQRSISAGNILADCRCNSRPVVVTIRSSEFAPARPDSTLSRGKAIDIEAPAAAAGRVHSVGFDAVESNRPDLLEARIVVGGGRALGARFFEVLAPLADSLGAAIGATRAACDSGHAPGDFQVGQTGKVIAPDLYVAVGISGAIQHLAGIRGSRTVVAINTDPDAPIFDVADYGLVGDLFDLVPELAGAIARHRRGAA
jgi:electron transfer flavoprotein alpha subunit